MGQKKFNQFLNDIDDIVRKHNTEIDILRHVGQLMENIIQNPASIPQEAFKPKENDRAINLIYMPDDKIFSVIGGVWLPGQRTPIHDHMTWAVIGIYDGEEKEYLYDRKDDGSNPNTGTIYEIESRLRKKGDVNLLNKDVIHSVENFSEKPVLTIQVYGLDIGNTERHEYDPDTGKIKTFIKHYDSILKNPLRS